MKTALDLDKLALAPAFNNAWEQDREKKNAGGQALIKVNKKEDI